MFLLGSLVKLIRPKEQVNGPEFRKRVEWLMLLRLMVTTLLLATTIFLQLRGAEDLFIEPAIPLYILIGTTFLLSLIYAFSLPLIPDLWGFSFFQVMVDVLYATVLIHFTGGASSVFTLLYIFPIITSGILHLRKGALVTASASCLLFGLLINFQFYGLLPPSNWPWISTWSKNTQFYLLWVLIVHFTFFYLVAMLSSTLAEQLQRTKTSLNLKEIDYEKLSELHTSIVRSIPSGIVTTDETDKITFVNRQGAMLLGTSQFELVSMPLRQVFPAIHNGISTSSIRKDSFFTVKDVKGEKKHFEVMVTDLKGGDSVPTGRLVVFQDVTHLRKMEERVKVSERQAAFVRIAAGMAHEIRNPMAALRGAAELLSRNPSGLDNEKRLLGIVLRESDRLNALLGDFLLTVSAQRPGKIRVMLSKLIEEVVDLFSREPRIRQGLSLETLINKGVEIEGDPVRLKQAVWNLLSNAADAIQEKGTIRVVLETPPNSCYAALTVQDSGTGILPEVRDRMFEPFTTTKEKGSGLGLALVLSVVESHNGTIEYDNIPGAGAAFVVRLPLAEELAGRQGDEENGCTPSRSGR
ncbi:MAG: PAS domain S-box protein [Desulfomonile tiedjei]|uniref:histidine kinase n=1 Tax=Desulfomonile tiedjei TaxID=2358 RepID=A0A9D6Z4Y2_9BACT|nr:PAS domain S-box protein [Desulfomonile tiedjei]